MREEEMHTEFEDIMQKFANDPADMITESVDGFVKCYPEIISPTENGKVFKYSGAPVAGKVGLISGGGAGHDPAFIGYIGKNMLDAVAVGGIFVPPTAEEFYEAIKAVDAGSGVACLYGNYMRDRDNVARAIEMAARDGISVKAVIANDDVAVSDRDKRRGLAGEVLMWKIGGAAAALGYDLDAVIAVTQKAIESTRSMGVGLSSCIIPMVGRANYIIEQGTMEIGIGHHGDPSLDTSKLKPADEIVDRMLAAIFEDMPLAAGDEVAILISGLGNTMLMEQNILFRRAFDSLSDMGVKIGWSNVGNFFTSLDMMGATITLMKLDAELKKLLCTPANCYALKIV